MVNAGDNQISFIPFKLACDGVGSLEGWLCRRAGNRLSYCETYTNPACEQ